MQVSINHCLNALGGWIAMGKSLCAWIRYFILLSIHLKRTNWFAEIILSICAQSMIYCFVVILHIIKDITYFNTVDVEFFYVSVGCNITIKRSRNGEKMYLLSTTGLNGYRNTKHDSTSFLFVSENY